MMRTVKLTSPMSVGTWILSGYAACAGVTTGAEVLRLLARGYTYKEIGQQLFISVKTVETHASNILRKTQTSNRHQLTRWAADRALD